MTTLISSLAGETPAHSVPEQTEVATPKARAEGQQMNGIIEDRSSVSSTDMLVRSDESLVIHKAFKLSGSHKHWESNTNTIFLNMKQKSTKQTQGLTPHQIEQTPLHRKTGADVFLCKI